MKVDRVSFEVAKAIKEAGYPQGQEDYAYRSNGEIYIFENMFDHIPDYCCDAPTYLEVWLWLWREKKINIAMSEGTCVIRQYGVLQENFAHSDPEEAIIAAIEYIVEQKLLK